MLKELASFISKPIAAILNKSFHAENIPSDWRRANVCAIFKKGSKSIAENYRPISLTSIVCKIMEKFVKNTVMNHLQEYGLISQR